MTSSLQTYPYADLQLTDAVTGKWMLSDCADRDAFARLRVSAPVTLFEGSSIYDSNPIFFDNDLTSNASITGPGSNACMTLSVNSSSTVNQYAARQTHFYSRYQPGKSFLALFSFSFGPAVVGITKRAGFYDVDNDDDNNPENGILLEQTTTGLAWKVYKGDGTVQTALRSDWNVDPLNGTGASGLNLNTTENLLAFVDMEWLGVGRVRVGFFIGGVSVIAHCFNNSQFSTPYTNNPLLPIRYEVRKTVANANSASMNAICCTIISEGGFEQIGIVRSLRSPWVSINNSLKKSLLALRLKENFPRSSLTASSLEIASDIGGNATAYYQLYLWRPSSFAFSIPGTWINVASASSVGGYGSFAEYNTSDALYTAISNDVNNNSAICILLGESSITSIAKSSFEAIERSLASVQSAVDKRNRDIYVVVVNNVTSNSRNFSALFTWREF